MAELEAKNADARREMAAADALDEIRQRNARINRSEKEGVDFADAIVRPEDEERARQEREDEEAARRAFAAARGGGWSDGDVVEEPVLSSSSAAAAAAVSAGQAPTSKPGGEDAASSSDSKPSQAPLDAAPSFKRVVKKKKDHSGLLGIKKKPSLV